MNKTVLLTVYLRGCWCVLFTGIVRYESVKKLRGGDGYGGRSSLQVRQKLMVLIMLQTADRLAERVLSHRHLLSIVESYTRQQQVYLKIFLKIQSLQKPL